MSIPKHPEMRSVGKNEQGVQSSLENSSYGGMEPPEEGKSVPAEANHSLNMQQIRVGAPPILWAWWSAALAVSITLWVLIFKLLF